MIELTRANSQYLKRTLSDTPPIVGSICFWLELKDLTVIQSLYYRNDTYKVFVDTSGIINVYLARKKTSWTKSVTPLVINTKYHITISFEDTGGNTTNSIYINGVLDVSDSKSDGDPDDTVLYLGMEDDNDYLNGYMEDWRFYNRSLLLAEIENIYGGKGIDGIKNGLVDKYFMNGVEGVEFGWKDTFTNSQFNYGVAISNGKIYVSENTQHKITVWNESTLAYITSFGSSGNGNGEFNDPRGIAINDGKIYVVDKNNDRVSVWIESTLIWSAHFGTSGGGDGNLLDPIYIAIISSKIYVTDFGNDRVSVWHESTLTWDANSGITDNPQGIAVTSTKIFISSNATNHEIIVLNRSDLSSDTTFSSSGSGDGELSYPSDIYIYDNIIYVTESGNDRVSLFNLSDYSWITSYGETGSGEGQFNTQKGIAINGSFIYIVDYSNKRVVKFQYYGSDMINTGIGDINLRGVHLPKFIGTELKSRRMVYG